MDVLHQGLLGEEAAPLVGTGAGERGLRHREHGEQARRRARDGDQGGRRGRGEQSGRRGHDGHQGAASRAGRHRRGRPGLGATVGAGEPGPAASAWAPQRAAGLAAAARYCLAGGWSALAAQGVRREGAGRDVQVHTCARRAAPTHSGRRRRQCACARCGCPRLSERAPKDTWVLLRNCEYAISEYAVCPCNASLNL